MRSSNEYVGEVRRCSMTTPAAGVCRRRRQSIIRKVEGEGVGPNDITHPTRRGAANIDRGMFQTRSPGLSLRMRVSLPAAVGESSAAVQAGLFQVAGGDHEDEPRQPPVASRVEGEGSP